MTQLLRSRSFSVALRIVFLATVTLLIPLFPQAAAAQQAGTVFGLDGVSTEAISQISALLAEKEQRTTAQQKIDSQLLYGMRMFVQGEVVPGVSLPEVNLRWVESIGVQRVLVDIRTNPSEETSSNGRVAEWIVALGGQVIEDVPEFNAIHASLPLLQIEILAELPEVRFIASAPVRELDTGSINSEGDRTLGADTARVNFPGLATANVKVCVISDSASAAGITNSITNGNLSSGKVTVLTGQGGTGTDEGLAMMEIVNDIAPGVQLFFSSSGSSPAAFAQNILGLYNTFGCHVMVDDIRFGNEPPFQDGVIARAVNTVTAAGAVYFGSAGNSGNKKDGTSGTWVGDFVNGGAFTVPGVTTAYEVHSFQTSPTLQNFNVVNTGGSSYDLSLFWADPENASTNDYDVFQLNATGTAVVSASTNTQNGTQNAFENTTLSSAGGNRVVVVRKVGAASRALYLTTGRGRLSINTNGFARGHSASPDAMAVAAVPSAASNGGPFPNVYTAAQHVETFSSDGPARKFFQPNGTPVTPGNFLIGTGGGLVQQYPAVTAPDGVTTSVSGFAPFFGTSAAAPHAAGVAALLKAYKPTLTAAQIRAALISTALDIELAGSDSNSGAGILRPVNALTSVAGLLPNSNLRDFNADGKSDLLWQHADGSNVMWLMNGSSLASSIYLLGAGSGWSVKHTGDFNGDGKSDLVWQHTDGTNVMWLMNGLSLAGSTVLLGAGSGWSVTHTGDFNGDGKKDLVWRHTDGTVVMWIMDGLTRVSSATLLGANSGWSVRFVGDFDGDGKSDLVWQHADGTNVMWLMNGLTRVSSATLLGANSGWSVKQIGDFNGDGKSDLVWQHIDGTNVMWLMNGLNLVSSTTLLGAGSGWSVTHIGDFNGDGKSDLVWRHINGATYLWLMNGLATISTAPLLPAGSGWSVKHIGDFNADGKSDLIWQHTAGGTYVWLMNGLSYISSTPLLPDASGWTPLQ